MKYLLLILSLVLLLGGPVYAETISWVVPWSNDGHLWLPLPEPPYLPVPEGQTLITDSAHGVLYNLPDGGLIDWGTLLYGSIWSYSEDGNFKFDSWNIPAWVYRTPGQKKPKGAKASGAVRIHLMNGTYQLGVSGSSSKEKPVNGDWYCYNDSNIGAPTFGMISVIQKGNKGSYADGTKTIAQRGCLLSSILAWGEYYWSWILMDINQWNDLMVQEKGFSGRNVKCSVAANLLNMIYVGEFSYSKATVEKYMARHWGIVLGVPRPGGKHWIVINPGVVLMPGTYSLGIMDPYQRGWYLDQTTYSPKRLKIFAPRVMILDPPDLVKSPLPSSELNKGGQIEVATTSGVFIEKVETPEFTLTKENSGQMAEYATLSDTTGDDEHDDTIDDGGLFSADSPNDRSASNIMEAVFGQYKYYLTGVPNAAYTLSASLGDNIGPFRGREFSGKLDATGKAVVVINFDPGYVVRKLGAIRQIAVGRQVAISAMEVTDSSADEFFLEDADRSGGMRVISSVQPAVGSRVSVTGSIKSVAPEITVEASRVQTQNGFSTVAPFGIASANWPEMANCLLAKIWGRVVSVDGTTVVLDNGSGPITVKEVDVPVRGGDFLTVNTVLRADRTVKAIAGSCQIR